MKLDQARNLALLVVLAAIAFVLTDYQFKAAARVEYPGPALAGFFGGFYAATSVAALFVQLLLVHLVLQKGGVLGAVCVVPASLLLTGVGIGTSGGFGWIVAAKVVDPVLDVTINAAALQLLFVGIRKQSRTQARAFIDGVVKPGAAAATGLALLAMGGDPDFRHLGTIVAATCAVWLFLAWRSHRAYVRGLVDSLGARRLDLSEATDSLHDRTLANHVRRSLREAPDDDIPYLLGLLPELDELDWSEEHRLLLRRESPEVKVAALLYLREKGTAGDRPAVLAHLGHPDAAVRTAAIHGAAALRGQDVVEALKLRLEDADPGVRAAAAAELVNVGDLDGLMSACVCIQSMLGSQSRELRKAAASGLAHIRHQGLTRPLATLLADADAEVRAAALAACRERPDPELIASVLPLLGEPRLGALAAETLVAFGAPVLEPIAASLARGREAVPGDGAQRLPDVLARVGDRRAIPLLRGLLSAPDLVQRSAAFDAYCRLVQKEPNRRAHAFDIETAARREAASASERLQALRALEQVDAPAFLSSALREDLDLHLRNVFRLLDLVSPSVDMKAILHNLTGEMAPEKRAEALEVLDNVLEGEIKTILLALLEPGAARVGEEAAADAPFARLLHDSASEWVTAGAIYSAAENQLSACLPQIRGLLDHPSAPVRETALHALGRLEGPAALGEACERMGLDASPAVRKLAQALAAAAAERNVGTP